MTDIYLHFRCTHYGLYGNAPVVFCVSLFVAAALSLARAVDDFHLQEKLENYEGHEGAICGVACVESRWDAKAQSYDSLDRELHRIYSVRIRLSYVTSATVTHCCMPEVLMSDVQLTGVPWSCHFQPCMTEIYLHIVARMADKSVHGRVKGLTRARPPRCQR